MRLEFKLNGRDLTVEAEPAKSLLDFLRDDMKLTGTKKGCEIGECGACTVLINKKAVNSCMVMVGQIEGCEVLTIEGISGEVLIPLQGKLLNGGAVQCGFCTPGMIMAILGLLYENPAPDAEEIRRAIDGNLCRCTGYNQIIKSVEELRLSEVVLK
ncbi:(2Fe-2S)-binding protein [Clostridium sp. YIM B02515]|uniref:(2Fe-2S)-binding protein n=1 Tax=Clostridium rhizosphaerae TaxID=2803861 RepID=A0ABS1TFY4_9CLOT|nr:(2Fe-2S)-binding protein [Clostridium rhizosphaerae]MBL4938308.1 (2Fe-2S)-binding protein [Clostridium rhizosphaerae]